MFYRKNIKYCFMIVIAFLLALSFPAQEVFSIEAADVLGMIDLGCIDLRVIGVCMKPPGIPGIVIMYWEPALLIETVKQPGDTLIESIKPLVTGITAKSAANIMSQAVGLFTPVSSGSNSSKISGANLQFNEAHVYSFPFRDQIMAVIDMECPDKLPTGSFIKYLSELDASEWRIGAIEALHPKSIVSVASGLTCALSGAFLDDLCMGFWGPTYPRRGFFTHQSEVVGSAAAAVRAVSIASFLGSTSHVVLETTGFMPSLENDKLELIYPKPSSCIKIGQNPLTWESGKLSSSGKYLWVYWRRRICCIY